jgi:hypothetical protein
MVAPDGLGRTDLVGSRKPRCGVSLAAHFHVGFLPQAPSLTANQILPSNQYRDVEVAVRRIAFLAILVGSTLAAFAQDAPRPRFEVASVKKQASQIPSGPPGAAPPLNPTFRRRNATVVSLIRTAYNVMEAQVVGGPDWVRKDFFEINAKAAGAASLDEMRPMVASLLAERFNLILHREQRAMRGAILVMDREDRRAGPKLSRSSRLRQNRSRRVVVLSLLLFGPHADFRGPLTRPC